MSHSFVSDPQSGAGNCTCGASELHRRHPHPFTLAHIWAQRVGAPRCVCGLPQAEPIHEGETMSNREEAIKILNDCRSEHLSPAIHCPSRMKATQRVDALIAAGLIPPDKDEDTTKLIAEAEGMIEIIETDAVYAMDARYLIQRLTDQIIASPVPVVAGLHETTNEQLADAWDAGKDWAERALSGNLTRKELFSHPFNPFRASTGNKENN